MRTPSLAARVQLSRQRLVNHPGHPDQKVHGGGRTGRAALDAAPLGLVDHKVNPVTGKITSKPGPGMTDDEAKALARYREAGFVKVNKSLRKNAGEVPPGLDGKTTANIDSAMSRSRLTDDVSVERGIGNGAATFGDAWQGDMTGLTFVDHGFVSTTADSSIAGEFTQRPGIPDGTGARARVSVPAGVGAVRVSDQGPGMEAELLLERGLTFEVVSDTGPGPGREIEIAVRP